MTTTATTSTKTATGIRLSADILTAMSGSCKQTKCRILSALPIISSVVSGHTSSLLLSLEWYVEHVCSHRALLSVIPSVSTTCLGICGLHSVMHCSYPRHIWLSFVRELHPFAGVSQSIQCLKNLHAYFFVILLVKHVSWFGRTLSSEVPHLCVEFEKKTEVELAEHFRMQCP